MRRTALTGTYLGQLFESLATLSVRVFAQSADARVFHVPVRDAEHELDLLAHGDDGGMVALEVKLSTTIGGDDVKHLHWLEGRVGEQVVDKAVLTPDPAPTVERTASRSSRSRCAAADAAGPVVQGALR